MRTASPDLSWFATPDTPPVPAGIDETFLLGLVSKWKPRLGLHAWDISFDTSGELDPDHDAECLWSDDYWDAKIKLNAHWRDWARQKAEENVVHELLHIVFRDLDQAFKGAARELSPSARGIAGHTFEHALEGLIERLVFTLLRPDKAER